MMLGIPKSKTAVAAEGLENDCTRIEA